MTQPLTYCTCPQPPAGLTEVSYVTLDGIDPSVPTRYINADGQTVTICPTCHGRLRLTLDFLAHFWHLPHPEVLAKLAAPKSERDERINRAIREGRQTWYTAPDGTRLKEWFQVPNPTAGSDQPE